MNEAREQDRVTLTKKLEKVCPHFHCMHLMFGERPNVNSQALGVVGLPNQVEVSHDTELDLDDDLDKLHFPGDHIETLLS